MFSTHSLTSKTPKVRNAVLLFMSIVLGLGSVLVRAANDAISIDTSITNAVQTIMKIIITDNGTQGGATGLVIDGAGGGITISNTMVPQGNIQNVLGTDSAGKVYMTGVSTIGGAGGGSYGGGGTSYWTGNLTNDIYNTNATKNVNIGGTAQPGARLQVESNNTSTIYLKETTTAGSNIVFKDGSTTGWMVLGNGNNFYIGMFTGANITNPLFRIYANGNIGIGTLATSGTLAKLEVNGNIRLSSAGWIGATGTNQVYLDNSNGYVGIGTGIPSQKLEVNGNIKLSSAGWIGATGSQIYMDNAGGYYVGIGTGTPSQKLEVNGNIKLTSKGWIGATGNQLYLTTGGYVGINDPLPSEALSINGNIFSNGNMILKNAAYIGYTGYTSQLYFYNNGKIGIGTNTPTNTEALTLSGNIKLTSGGRIGYTGNQIYMGPNGYVGIGTGTPQYKLDINGGAAADSWYLHSDKRLKKDITPMNDALDKILSLNGYYFTRKNTGVKSFGVIAQEVEQAFPQIVNTSADGIMSVSYDNLVAPLIQAVKALNTKITQIRNLYFDQQQEIDQLKTRIETLENKLP